MKRSDVDLVLIQVDRLFRSINLSEMPAESMVYVTQVIINLERLKESGEKEDISIDKAQISQVADSLQMILKHKQAA